MPEKPPDPPPTGRHRQQTAWIFFIGLAGIVAALGSLFHGLAAAGAGLLGLLAFVFLRQQTAWSETEALLRQQVSALAASEQALHSRDQMLRLVMDNLPALAAYWDKNQQCRFANIAYKEWFGLPPAEIIGKTLAELLGSTAYAQNEPHIRAVLTGRDQQFERTLHRPDGSIRHTQAHYIPHRNGEEVLGFFALVFDVSDLHQTRVELRDSEARMRAIVEHTLDGIITIDPAGTIHTVNPAAERLFGYAAVEMVGRNIKMLMPEPHQSRHDGYLAHYMAGGPAKIIGSGREVEGLTKSGDVFPMELAVSEVQLQGQRLFVGGIHDLSEHHKIDSLKAEFISTVSHELRTPLTAIRGSLSLVNAGVLGPVPAEIRELTEIAEQSTLRLVRLINDILDMEQIGSGQLRLAMADITVVDILDRAVTDNASFAAQYGVTLARGEVSPDLRVRADFDRLLQVLTNLISNAVKFSPAGSVVELETTPFPSRTVRLSVRDHGPGISKAFRPRIFEKFAQADGSDRKLKGGTGLGLSISKGLVERMGGTLSFESEIGVGTVFSVDLEASACPVP